MRPPLAWWIIFGVAVLLALIVPLPSEELRSTCWPPACWSACSLEDAPHE